MIRPINHNCGTRLATFNERGHILDADGNSFSVGIIEVIVFRAALRCPKCDMKYIFDGKTEIKKQRKVIDKFEVEVYKVER